MDVRSWYSVETERSSEAVLMELMEIFEENGWKAEDRSNKAKMGLREVEGSTASRKNGGQTNILIASPAYFNHPLGPIPVIIHRTEEETKITTVDAETLSLIYNQLSDSKLNSLWDELRRIINEITVYR